MPKLRIAVLFGGRSGEHEISLLSAASIMGALDRDRYAIFPVGISREGRWLVGADPLAAMQAGDVQALVPALLSTDPEVRGLLPVSGSDSLAAAGGVHPTFDVAFPVLHGTYGEDGTVQGLLELAGVPYVGCGVAASAVGMDKGLMKAVFAASGLPQVRYQVLLRADIERDPAATARRLAAELPLPVFVKPCNLGSSVGVSKVSDWDDLPAALARAGRYDRRVIVEEGVTAREIEVAVLGNDRPQASVAGEIVPGAEFYDYRAKYLDDCSRTSIPARLPAEVATRVGELAVAAFHAIDGAGMARADFLYDEANGRVYVNEVNTIPGFTKISMYPKLWEASGLPYPALLDRLVELALERHGDRRRNETTLGSA